MNHFIYSSFLWLLREYFVHAININSQAGFSLAEVIVAAGIAAALSFGMLTVMTDFYKDLNNSKRNLEFQETSNLIDISLASTDTCQKMFEGKKINLALGDLNPRILKPAELIQVDDLFIRGIKFQTLNKEQNGILPIFIGFDKVYKSFPANGLPINYYVFDFIFKAKKVGFFRGREEKVKTAMIYLKVDNVGHHIVGCGLTTTEEGTCILQGKTFNLNDFPFCK